MRYGIYLTFDAHAEQSIECLRKQLPGAPKMAPHLTLLVFDDADHARVLETFEGFIIDFKTFPIILEKAAAFPGRRNVLYIEPAASEALKEAYLRCLGAFAHVSVVPRYREPAHWKPHVTLVKGIGAEELRTAMAAAKKEWVPLKADICSIGLINVQKPLEALASKALGSE